MIRLKGMTTNDDLRAGEEVRGFSSFSILIGSKLNFISGFIFYKVFSVS